MLDFNDTPTPVPRDFDAEREAIRTELFARLEPVLAALFPAGKKRGGKFLTGDVLGSPGDSLEIVLDGDKAGLWTDRATGDGGDIFALIAAHHGASSCIISATIVVSTTETAATVPMRPWAGRVPMSASSRPKPVRVRSSSRAPSRTSSTTALP